MYSVVSLLVGFEVLVCNFFKLAQHDSVNYLY